jgi:hypothetical protein
MRTLSMRLPESIHKKAKELAEREGISLNQFMATAVAEKLAALMTEEYLRERGSRRKFDRVLKKVRSRPVQSGDER